MATELAKLEKDLEFAGYSRAAQSLERLRRELQLSDLLPSDLSGLAVEFGRNLNSVCGSKMEDEISLLDLIYWDSEKIAKQPKEVRDTIDGRVNPPKEWVEFMSKISLRERQFVARSLSWIIKCTFRGGFYNRNKIAATFTIGQLRSILDDDGYSYLGEEASKTFKFLKVAFKKVQSQ